MDDLSKLSLSELLARQTWATEQSAAAKAHAENVKAELARRFGDSAKQALSQQGKEHGSLSLPLQDGFVAKADVKRTVKWDSAKLMEIAQTLPWDRVNALFKIAFSIPETTYKGIEAVAPELRARIDEARTTQTGDPVITLIREG